MTLVRALATAGLALGAVQLFRHLEAAPAVPATATPGPSSASSIGAPGAVSTFQSATVTARPWLSPGLLLAVLLVLVSGTLYYTSERDE